MALDIIVLVNVAPTEVTPPATPTAAPTLETISDAPNVTGISPTPTTASPPLTIDVTAPATLDLLAS